MAVSVARYEALKRAVEQAGKESERAEGVLSQIRRDLKAEFGLKDEDEAARELAKLEKTQARDEKELEEKVTELEARYGEEDDG